MKYYTTARISENMHETPEGYLVCVGVPIARTGEMIYADGESPIEVDDTGKALIDREADELFRPETMASFEGKPVTITHPTDFVTPDNWSRLAKGYLQNVRRGTGAEKDDLLADVIITDSMTIGLVKNGLREVSCGYDARFVSTEEGRGYQTHIIGNHLALVQKGRAGSAYAIHDHKGKGENKMSLKDKIGSIFAKAQDEAMKAAKDAEGEEKKEPKKEESKDDAGSMADILAALKALEAKIEAMDVPAADEAEPKKKELPKKLEEGKDDGEEPPVEKNEADEPAVEDRLTALEASVAKILELLDDGGDEEEESGEEQTGDEEGMKKSTLTGDTASRAEILSPGIKASKDVKKAALKAAYGTTEGKKLIESLTGGRAPAFDSAEKIENLFIAASELMKAKRSNQFSGTKSATYDHNAFADESSAMTPEKINEINAKHFGKK